MIIQPRNISVYIHTYVRLSHNKNGYPREIFSNNKETEKELGMPLQTVFVTNRNLNSGSAAKKHLFGNELDNTGSNRTAQIHFANAQPFDKEIIRKRKLSNKITRTYRSIKKTYQLELQTSDQRSGYLQNIVASSDNGRPWVFFIHGNNQTLSKNLVKSRQIQDEYQVNMVVFSWPSMSYDPKLIPNLVLAGLLSSNPSTAVLAKWVGKKAIKKKIKQYKIARKVAEKTAPHFIEAFNIVRDELLQPLQESHAPHTCLLVHSLGHHVLRTVVDSANPIPANYEFNTCLLHQADEENEDHQDWIVRMPIAAEASTHVTRNKKDLVLLMSGIVNNDFDFSKAMTRLGNRSNHDSEQGSPLNYIEFSGLDDVGVGHGVAWDDGRSPEVDALCRPILTGE